MDELIDRIVTAAGVSRGQAQEAVSIIVNFLSREGSRDTVGLMLENIPGAANLIQQKGEAGRSGLLGGLKGLAGGSAMEVLSDLSAQGLDMGQVTATAKEIVAFAREQAGDDVVDKALAQIPILARII